MDDSIRRLFFPKPERLAHRHFDALRAIFIAGLPLNQVADRYGSRPTGPVAGLEVPERMSRWWPTPFFILSRSRRPAARKMCEDEGGPQRPEVADCCVLNLAPDRSWRTRVAGVFLFLPLLARVSFQQLVSDAAFPGSRMIAAANALLSLPALRLSDKERKSHRWY
jgi:hypothetical protein